MNLQSIAAVLLMAALLVGCGPPKPSCEERGGQLVMAGAVAVMAGQVAIPVPYYKCTVDDKK